MAFIDYMNCATSTFFYSQKNIIVNNEDQIILFAFPPPSTINNISGVMINNSDPNSIPQPGLSGLINLIIFVVISSCHSHSLICTCRGQNIGKYFHI